MRHKLKLAAILVVICIVMFCFAACGGGGNLADDVNKIFSSGTYQMSITMTVSNGSSTTSSDMTIGVKDQSTAIKLSSSGQNLRLIIKSDKYYVISDTEKVAYIMDIANNEMPDYSEIFSATRTYTNKTNVTIDGKKLTCEEYKISDGTIKYYFDGKTLVKMDLVYKSFTQTIKINEIKSTVDAVLFDIPSDYQQLSF